LNAEHFFDSLVEHYMVNMTSGEESFMHTNSVLLYKEKHKFAAPFFGALTMIPITFGLILLIFDRASLNFIIGSFIVGAIGIIGLSRLVDWKKDAKLKKLWEDNLNATESMGYHTVVSAESVKSENMVLPDNVYQAVLLDKDKRNVIIYELAEKDSFRHPGQWYLKDTRFSCADIQSIAFQTKPEEFKVKYNHNNFSTAGLLLYGPAGLVGGAILSEITKFFKGAKQIDFQVTLVFRLIGGTQHGCCALNAKYLLTDSNRYGLEGFFQEKVFKKIEGLLSVINQSFPGLLSDMT